MPVVYKLLGYGGNGLLLALGLFGFASGKDGAWLAVAFIALGGLNLFLIRKLDIYSREEVWLQAEVRKRELRQRIEELDREEAARGTTKGPEA
jgi:hypothetical protein